MTQSEYQVEQKIKLWNMGAIAVFVILGGWAYLCLEAGDKLPETISIGVFVVLALAIFRIIRLVAYDNIMLFLREAFLDTQIEGNVVTRIPSKSSFKQTVSKLLNCPWCIGVWIALGVTYLYWNFPELYVVFIVLALSSVASLLQILTNLIGWSAEERKVKTGELMSQNK